MNQNNNNNISLKLQENTPHEKMKLLQEVIPAIRLEDENKINLVENQLENDYLSNNLLELEFLKILKISH